FETSRTEIFFQFAADSSGTAAPLIFNSNRLAARINNCADFGSDSNVQLRRNVASIVATRCERGSGGAGKTIHLARWSPGRKLIFGSRSHFQTSHPTARAAAKMRTIVVEICFNGGSPVAVAR